MAHLGGKSIRTVVTSLEVLSDDGKMVLMLDGSGDGVVIKTRKIHESTYAYDLPRWTVTKRDTEVLAFVITNRDAQYSATQIAEISSSDFEGENVDAAEVEKQVEARCSQLDIERAKAENIREEAELVKRQLVVQHMDDKHISADAPGCEMCENRYRSTTIGAPFPGDSDES